jgi:hypothetical protein
MGKRNNWKKSGGGADKYFSPQTHPFTIYLNISIRNPKITCWS